MGRKRLAPEVTAERERVGAALQAARKRKEITPTQLAATLGISRPYLANIEAGRRPLTDELATKVTALLATDVAA